METARIMFGAFRLDPRQRILWRDGVTVALGGRAADILCVLAAANGALVTKDALMAEVWPGQLVEENTLQAQISHLRKVLGGAGERHIVTVPGRGYRLVCEAAAADLGARPASPERASVAVLPFANMSDDPQQEYFADGIVEDIITALSRVRWLFVISRNSTFTYKDRIVDVRTIGRELGVRYVLEGSVRKALGRVRITGQLIEAESRAHVWADRFDGDLQDVFALQDQVTDSIVRAIAPTLRHAELERVRRKRPENMDAYDLYLRALPHWYAMTKDRNEEASRLLQQALVLDPAYAPALALQGLVLAYRSAQGWIQPPGSRHSEIVHLAREAVQNDPNDADVVASASHLLAYGGLEHDEATRLAHRACVLGPNSAFAWGQAGYALFHTGHAGESVSCFRRAILLDPVDPMGFSTMGGLTYALLYLQQDIEAIDVATRAVQQNPNYTFAWRGLAAALALSNRIDEGRKALGHVLRLEPNFTISALIARTPSAPKRFVRVIEGLRLLGAPEQ